MNTKQQAIVAEVFAALEADQLDLPVLPGMALKVRNLLDDPDSSISQFVQLISTDLSISLYIIKAANSATISKGRPVGNLRDAISRIGYRMLHSIVMDITLTKLFHARSLLINKKLTELWEHSLKVAANCYVLAQPQKQLKAEDAMLAGLVNDIGALPLCLYADRHHPEIDSAMLEDLISKFSVPVGIKLLQSWNFPVELIDAIAGNKNQQHITPSDVADYVDVVTVANLETQEAAKTITWRNVLAAERLGLYPGDCKNFSTSHAEQVAAANKILGIDVAQ